MYSIFIPVDLKSCDSLFTLPCFVRLLDSRLRDTKLLLNYRSPQHSNAHWELMKRLDPRFMYRRPHKSNLGTLLSRTQFARRSTRLALPHWFTRSSNGHIPITFTQRAYMTH